MHRHHTRSLTVPVLGAAPPATRAREPTLDKRSAKTLSDLFERHPLEEILAELARLCEEAADATWPPTRDRVWQQRADDLSRLAQRTHR